MNAPENVESRPALLVAADILTALNRPFTRADVEIVADRLERAEVELFILDEERATVAEGCAQICDALNCTQAADTIRKKYNTKLKRPDPCDCPPKNAAGAG